MSPVQVMGWIGVVAAFVGTFVCWFIALINMFRTLAHRKPGVAIWPHWWESPFNILFRPEELTARGLVARRWCFFGVAGFLACFVLFLLVGIPTGVLH
jgi:hypothetical protein